MARSWGTRARKARVPGAGSSISLTGPMRLRYPGPCQTAASLFSSRPGKGRWDAFRPSLVHMSSQNLFYWLFALKGVEDQGEGGEEIELRKSAVEGRALSGVKVFEGILIKAT